MCGLYVSLFHLLYWALLSHSIMLTLVCPLVDFILQTTETAFLGISDWITDPPMGLLTHLQSHSRELIEAGVGSNRSVICENKV